MRKEKRIKEVKLRKNFFPTLLIIVILWIFLGFVIFFVDPFSFGAVALFFFLAFLALLFTLSFLLANARRGFLVTTGLTLFLILRNLGIGNALNLVLIIGLIITLEIFLSRK